MLQVQNLSLKYGKQTVLKDLNFKVVPGEMVAVIGASGAGKSSLFKLLLGEVKPSEGAVMLDQLSLGDLNFNSLQQYRQQIGVVFQEFKLLAQKTVFETWRLPLRSVGETAK